MYSCFLSTTFRSLIAFSSNQKATPATGTPSTIASNLFCCALLWAILLILLPPNALAQESVSSDTFNPSDSKQVDELLAPYREVAQKWREDVDKLSATNSHDGGKDHILFLGSSSFRLWESLTEDLAPFAIIKRAYGGAKFRDLAIYTPDLIRGIQFNRAVVFIANEITGKEDDTSPEVTRKLAHVVIDQLRREQPDATIFLLAVTPTPSRYEYWPQIQKTNQALRSLSEELNDVHYIPTATAFLDSDGFPRAEYFKDDKLHLNQSGYAVWSELIKRTLSEYEASRSK